MSIEMIQDKLLSYQCKTVLEQENALKEIAQDIALMALSRAGFFEKAAFQGGTCLRILYGLNRFSEDLDFVLEKPDSYFDMMYYVDSMAEEFSHYGYALEVVNKKNMAKVIRTVFLKAESSGGLLILKDLRTNRPKIQIKLEIDTHPPEGSLYEIKFLDFPLPYSVKVQDLASLFAGKCHALLCRPYTKGRDWFDFAWYVAKNSSINFNLLGHSLAQKGPWEGLDISINPAWFKIEMTAKIKETDFDLAKQDVQRFLSPSELPSLEVWSTEFFEFQLNKLMNQL